MILCHLLLISSQKLNCDCSVRRYDDFDRRFDGDCDSRREFVAVSDRHDDDETHHEVSRRNCSPRIVGVVLVLVVVAVVVVVFADSEIDTSESKRLGMKIRELS